MGTPAVIGSPSDWWNAYDGECKERLDWKGIWTCPWKENMHQAWIEPQVAALNGGCKQERIPGAVGLPNDAACRGQSSPYTVGTLTQYNDVSGKDATIALSPWAGVTGYVDFFPKIVSY